MTDELTAESISANAITADQISASVITANKIAGADTKALFNAIAENGITVNFEGLLKEVSRLKGLELEALEHLNELMDWPALKTYQPSFFTSKKDMEAEFFNPRSSKFLSAWFTHQGEDPPHAFNEGILEERMAGYPDHFDAVMQGRRIRKYWSDLESLRKHMASDGKVHYKWVEATTCRWYIRQPNLQTMAKIVREFLVPEKGNEFYVIDWSQQELRILAHFSKDPHLLQALADGDPHIVAYERVTGNKRSKDKFTFDQQRDLGKMLNYALIYGLEPQGLGGRMKIPNDQAAALIEAYFRAFPVLTEWREEQKRKVQASGEVVLPDGTKIPIDPKEGKGKPDRKAVNYYVQGTAAKQLVAALRRFLAVDKKVFAAVRATIHDAVLLEVPSSVEGKQMVGKAQQIMEVKAFDIDSPAVVKGPAMTWKQAMEWVDLPPV